MSFTISRDLVDASRPVENDDRYVSPTAHEYHSSTMV